MSLLEMKNIKKSFNGVEVLKDISLKVEKGEVLGIIIYKHINITI